LYDYLAQQGIGSQVIYPVLIPDQGAYRDQPLRCGPIPVARSLVGQILSLPMFPELRDDEIERIAAAIRAFYQ
ncbi:MAG TPA: DegT/DnrJ/EryC1/StrS family aminotransferase, partial [Ktedonobacteraceae bacterium]